MNTEHQTVCLKCNKSFYISACENCGNTTFKWNARSLQCSRCEKSWVNWTCPNCGTSNPFFRTVQRKYRALATFLGIGANIAFFGGLALADFTNLMSLILCIVGIGMLIYCGALFLSE